MGRSRRTIPEELLLLRHVGGLARHRCLLHTPGAQLLSAPNPLSEPCTSVLCEGLALLLDENDIPTGSLTNRSRTLDRPL